MAVEGDKVEHSWYPRATMAQEALTGLVWRAPASLTITRKLADGTVRPCTEGADYELGGDGANGAGWCRALRAEANDTIFRALRTTPRRQRKRFPRHEPVDAVELEAGLDLSVLADQEQDAALAAANDPGAAGRAWHQYGQ
jgi:hypothetical protein